MHTGTHLLMSRGVDDSTAEGAGLLAPARGGGGMRTASGFCGREAGVVVLDAAAFLLEEEAFIERAGRPWKPSTTTVVQPAARASTRRGRRRGAILLACWSGGVLLMAPEDFNPDRERVMRRLPLRRGGGGCLWNGRLLSVLGGWMGSSPRVRAVDHTNAAAQRGPKKERREEGGVNVACRPGMRMSACHSRSFVRSFETPRSRPTKPTHGRRKSQRAATFGWVWGGVWLP